ncbi:hypothetical protein EK904_014383, partial [Melospiza melodia maxima]
GKVLSPTRAQAVCHVLLGRAGEARGVVLQDGTEVRSKLVLSNASPQITFLELIPQEQLPKDFVQRIRQLDTRSPVTKINVFDCIEDYAPGFKASVIGRDILTPPDLERIFGLPGGVGTMSVSSEHRSGASASGHTGLGQAQLAHTELCWQNIFHGGMSLDQLYFARPVPSYSGYRSPIPGLYLCGSGAHPGEQSWQQDPHGGLQKEESAMWKRCSSIPHFSSLAGGGVMGAAGRNAAQVAIKDFRHL